MNRKQIKSIRINQEVKRSLTEIIARLRDERIHPMTSVLDVHVTPDRRHAKIEISIMADEQAKEETMEGLDRAKGFIRSQLAQELNMRYTPELHFVQNDNIDYAIRMGNRIDEVIRDDEAKHRD